MSEKNLVNETLLQIQNLEEVINENAKEILASTMKEEISELVKESMKEETDEEVEMKEAEEDELETEVEFEDEEESEEDESEEGEEYEEEDEMGDMSMMGMDDMTDMDDEDMMGMDDEPVADLTGEDDFEEVFKVFKNMKNSDTVTVVPDGDYTKISDDETEAEYLLQMEGEEEEEEDDETEEGYQAMEEMYEDASYQPDEETEEVVYEIEINTPSDELEEEEYEFELEEGSYEDAEDNESYNMMEARKAKKMKMETKEGMKPKVGKNVSLGSAKNAQGAKIKTSKGGFKETMKKVNPTKGTGKPKFEFKEGEKMEMLPKKGEAKEAARTYGMGSKSGRGLRKGITPNRNYEYGKNVAESVEVMEELQMLRTKNEEYRKALNLFRDKLNEVAIFNSNLAYATRLFTEHSTSKHEKINILRRFDTAETLKESKALYKTIKDELSQGTKATPITESIERVIDREPQSGSAINLIESKTYENPQFLRMKDIMSKIAK
jgi:hypothetical protein